MCAGCFTENTADNKFCGRCGQPLTAAKGPSSPQGKVSESVPTSVVLIIVFGAFLAVVSVIYPWYLLGEQLPSEGTPVTIMDQLLNGWHWFPGVPLILIVLSVLAATVLAILAHRGKAHPAPSLAFGLVSLLSTIWLWQGLVTGTPNPAEWELAPMLATIGAILVLVGGSMAARPLLHH